LNRDIEKQYIKLIGYIDASGMRIEKFQALYVKNLQRGLQPQDKMLRMDKDRNRALKEQLDIHKRVQTSAVNTAMVLGMNADAMNDTFMDWHLQLTMSANQLGEMGRAMRGIALETGVSGENLERAVKSADQIMKTMRSAGTLTTEAAKNVLRMTTMAQKLGVEDAFNPVIQAMGSATGFNNADVATRGFLARSTHLGGGDFLKLKAGQSLNDKDQLQKITAGMESQIGGVLKNNFGVKVGKDFDFTKLSEVMKTMNPADAMRFQLIMKRLTGLEVGDLERSLAVMKDSSKSVGDRMAGLDKEIQHAIDWKGKESAAVKELQKRKEDLELKSIQDMYGKLADELRAGKPFDQAFENVRKVLEKDFGPDMTKDMMGNLGKTTDKMMGILQSKAKAVGKDVNEIMKKNGMSMVEVRQALTSGSARERSVATGVVETAMQEILKGEGAKQDPITDIAMWVQGIHNNIENIVQQFGFANDWLRWITFWVSKTTGGVFALLGLFQAGNWIASLMRPRGGSKVPSTPGAPGMPGAPAIPGMPRTPKPLLTTRPDVMGRAPFEIKTPPLTSQVGSAGGRAVTATLSKIGVAVMLLVGAVKGWREADKAGRTKLEGTLLGALTGGAKIGGGFAGRMLGTKEGSVADKAIGVAGAGAWGAALGAMIGSIFPVVGTGIGALVGGITGMLVEGIKILTQGTKVLERVLSPFQFLIDQVTGTFKDLWDVLAGIFTLDIGRVINGVFSLIGRQIMFLPNLAMKSFQAVFLGLPELFLRSIKALWLDLPKLVMDGIKSSLESLKSNEWVGPIFEVLSDAFNTLHGAFMDVYTPLSEAFDSIFKSFNEISEALFGVSLEGSLFKTIVWGLSKGIAFLLTPLKGIAEVIKIAVQPIKMFADGLAYLAKTVSGFVDWIATKAKWLWSKITGGETKTTAEKTQPKTPATTATPKVAPPKTPATTTAPKITPPERGSPGWKPTTEYEKTFQSQLRDKYRLKEAANKLGSPIPGKTIEGTLVNGQVVPPSPATGSNMQGVKGDGSIVFGKKSPTIPITPPKTTTAPKGISPPKVTSTTPTEITPPKTDVAPVNINKQLADASAVKATSPEGSTVKTNTMDYSDEMKAVASPVLMPNSMMEERVAREKYSASPGNKIDLSPIEDQLAMERNIMQTMVNLLTNIRDNTSSKVRPQVVGAKGRGQPAHEGMGMRHASRDQGAGQWNLTYGDYSPGFVTTQGRRG
jgi:hypothetical protein